METIRIVDGRRPDYSPPRAPNAVSTTLYRIYNFLPLALFYQMAKSSNIYFMTICILSMIPAVSSISPISAVAPVIFVIMFGVVFDLWEDANRFLKDKATNSIKARVWRKGGWVTTEAQNLAPGDLVHIKDGGEICADMVLLSHKSRSSYAFIRTSNLDGEKNLKPKVSVFHHPPEGKEFVAEYPEFEVSVHPNTEFLDKFSGAATFVPKTQDSNSKSNILLTNSNFMPRSCILRNTQEAIGLVVYVGMDTKIMRNTKLRRIKVSTVEQQMGRYIAFIKLVVGIILILAATYAVAVTQNLAFFKVLDGVNDVRGVKLWAVTLGSYFLLLNTMLPISLIVTLQLVKAIFSLTFGQHDPLMADVRANTISMHEELGQIEYVLTDKTGTLTQNKMVLRRFQILTWLLSLDAKLDRTASTDFEPFSITSADGNCQVPITQQLQAENLFFLLLNTCHECFTEEPEQGAPEGRRATLVIQNGNIVDAKDLIAQMGNLTRPIGSAAGRNRKTLMDSFKTVGYSNRKLEGRMSEYQAASQAIEIQGPSPDEIALLRASKQHCGYLFKSSNTSQVVIHRDLDSEVTLDVLLITKFDSIRRMMSVVVRWAGQVYLFAKGADSSIEPRLAKNKSQAELHNEAAVFAANADFVGEGFRCLMFAVRVISNEEWAGFEEELAAAQKSADHEGATKGILERLEQHMVLLGASGIEDKLQENVDRSMAQLRKGGIKVWMITGDKLETAENISFNSGLFRPHNKTVRIKSKADLENLGDISGENVLVEGSFFGELFALGGEDYQRLCDLLIDCEAVTFGRTNANQKVQVVQMVKAAGKTTLAIGDGANDVNMIQEANVGVGIDGEEGRQASNAADFVLVRFDSLPDLIFSYGRLAYFRVTNLILFFFYKNFLFTFPQIIFGFMSDFSRLSVFPSWYMSLFNLMFTSMPVAARAMFDVDILDFGGNTRAVEIALYHIGKDGIGFNFFVFMRWIAVSACEIGLVLAFIYFGYSEGCYSRNHEATFEFMSMLLLGVIIYHLAIRITALTTTFNVFQIICYVMGFLLFTIYFLCSDFFSGLGYYKVNGQLWSTAGFWLAVGVCLFFLMATGSLYFRMRQILWPDMLQYVNRNITSRSRLKDFDALDNFYQRHYKTTQKKPQKNREKGKR